MSPIKPFPILTRNLKLLGALALIMMLSFSFVSNADFFTEQLKYERVRKAIKEKQTVISKLLASKSIDIDDFNLLIIAYKDADELDLYVKNKQDKSYKHIATYEICSRSGLSENKVTTRFRKVFIISKDSIPQVRSTSHLDSAIQINPIA